MMEAEVAKMQQAMAIQQTGTLPMPWDGASPPAGRVGYQITLIKRGAISLLVYCWSTDPFETSAIFVSIFQS